MGDRPECCVFRWQRGSEWSLQRRPVHCVLGQASRAFSSMSIVAPNCCQRAVLHKGSICTPPACHAVPHFKKYSTDVLFCTSKRSSRHNLTRLTKPSSRGSSGRGSLMTCQLTALCKRVVSRLSWTRAVSFPN